MLFQWLMSPCVYWNAGQQEGKVLLLSQSCSFNSFSTARHVITCCHFLREDCNHYVFRQCWAKISQTHQHSSLRRISLGEADSEVSSSKATGSFFYPIFKCSAAVGPLLTTLQLGELNPAPSCFGIHSEKFPWLLHACMHVELPAGRYFLQPITLIRTSDGYFFFSFS